MLFRVDRKGKVILEKDAIELCPELKGVSEDELLFVALAYDYEGPYHQFPLEDRVRKAKRDVFNNVETKVDEQPNVKLAIDAYVSLQYDAKRETISRYKQKIEMLSRQLLAEDNARKIGDYDDAIDRLLKRCKILQQEIDSDGHIAQIKGGGKISFIETWQKKRAEFLKSKQYEQDRTGIEVINGE